MSRIESGAMPRYAMFVLDILSPRRKASATGQVLLVLLLFAAVCLDSSQLSGWNARIFTGLFVLAISVPSFLLGLFWQHPGITSEDRAALKEEFGLYMIVFISVGFALFSATFADHRTVSFWHEFGEMALYYLSRILPLIYVPFLVGWHLARRRLAVNG